MSDIGPRAGSTAAAMLRESLERNATNANGGAVVTNAAVTHEQGVLILRNLEMFVIAATLHEQTLMFGRSGAATELVEACMMVVREKQREALIAFNGVQAVGDPS